MSESLPIIQKLIEQHDLESAETEQLFNAIVQGKLDVTLITAMLTALKIKGETPVEIAGAAKALHDNALPFPAVEYLCSDNCGTGGDGTHTINISTTSAIVAASLGIKMAKHGNRSVSSKSGSADVLGQLGINLNMTPEQAKLCLDETNLTFLMAPVYHSGIRHAMPIRQTLKVRTLFNILGPLINPAGASIQIIGVYDEKLITPIAQALKLLGKKAAWVVHGSGMDEMALHGSTEVIELKDGELARSTLTPADFGLSEYPLESIKGGTPEQNADNIKQILSGKGEEAHNAAIAINTAPLVLMNGLATDIKSATQMVLDQLHSGKALSTLERFVALSK